MYYIEISKIYQQSEGVVVPAVIDLEILFRGEENLKKMKVMKVMKALKVLKVANRDDSSTDFAISEEILL